MKIEMELVASEVLLVQAALRLGAFEFSTKTWSYRDSLADEIGAIGLYVFSPLEVAYITAALQDFAERLGVVGHMERADQAMSLSNHFIFAEMLYGKSVEDTAAFEKRQPTPDRGFYESLGRPDLDGVDAPPLTAEVVQRFFAVCGGKPREVHK